MELETQLTLGGVNQAVRRRRTRVEQADKWLTALLEQWREVFGLDTPVPLDRAADNLWRAFNDIESDAADSRIALAVEHLGEASYVLAREGCEPARPPASLSGRFAVRTPIGPRVVAGESTTTPMPAISADDVSVSSEYEVLDDDVGLVHIAPEGDDTPPAETPWCVELVAPGTLTDTEDWYVRLTEPAPYRGGLHDPVETRSVGSKQAAVATAEELVDEASSDE